MKWERFLDEGRVWVDRGVWSCCSSSLEMLSGTWITSISGKIAFGVGGVDVFKYL